MSTSLFQSLGWFGRGLVKRFLRALWALVRPILKVVSVVAMLGAIVALTSDVTRWQTGADGILFQSLAEIMRETAPATFDGVGQAIGQQVHPLVWDPLLIGLLNLPAWSVLFAIALVSGLAARERKPVDIFVN